MEQIEKNILWYNDALIKSVNSIIADPTQDEDSKMQYLNKSLEQYTNAMKTLFLESSTKNIEKNDPNRFDVIVEIEKANPYHDPKTGRFTSGPGGGAGISVASGGKTSSFGNASAKEFSEAVAKARESCSSDKKWRVTAHTEEELNSDYKGAKLHVTKGGSTVAVTTDGDIISVCKAKGDTLRGKDLMDMATKNGGKKLDSFSGNHDFYTKNGFEPVSWTPFNETYAPPGWRKGIDRPEPVIFYKHTGKQVNTTLKDFLANTKPFTGEDGYSQAMEHRDKSMEG